MPDPPEGHEWGVELASDHMIRLSLYALPEMSEILGNFEVACESEREYRQDGVPGMIVAMAERILIRFETAKRVNDMLGIPVQVR
ncbi:Uncharacterised protein [Mycobacteroides abscessus subsp. abscessus]|nr:Uncharacterised protein [Mycobacteroides abscessus subsp. abscessus]